MSIILDCIGITCTILNCIFGISLFPIITILLFSIALGYCVYHRLPLYNTIALDGINIIDYYIGIPFATKTMVILYSLVFTLGILIVVYMKYEHERKLKI